MAIAQDIIDAAYRKIGLKDPSVTDRTTALTMLNNMISAWGLHFLLPCLTRESFDLVIGQAEYTIGSGGDFDTVRPLSLNNIYLVNSDDYSFSVDVYGTKDYGRVRNKTLRGRPTKVYFIPEYSLAKLIFDKETDVVYTAYFEFNKNFTELAAVGTTIDLPSEYREAMIYNLAIRLAEDESIMLPQSVLQTAATTLVDISWHNALNRKPGKTKLDLASGSDYNIIIDE
jgi:hypothetical protein